MIDRRTLGNYMQRLFAATIVAGIGFAAPAATVIFDSTAKTSDLTLAEDPARPLVRETVSGTPVLAPPPNTDYFERDGIRFRVPDTFPRDGKPAYVVIEHLDRNIALMAVRYDADKAPVQENVHRPAAYTAGATLAGYTALGTQTPRHAVFRLDAPSFLHHQRNGGDFQIEGVRSLVKVTLSTELDPAVLDQARKEVPGKVESHLKLAKPMQLVTTVGIDVRGNSTLEENIASMNELAPLAAALGFNGAETYVRWSGIEAEKGKWDWTFYDGVVQKAQQYGLKWFPLLISGSAYTIPKWYAESADNVGFVCLEHHKKNNIQTIFADIHTPYAEEFIKRFGEHYEPMNVLLGVRLGPSGNYGESQYPAGGNWGYVGQKEHIHIGWWAGDEYAPGRFQTFLKAKYPDIGALNKAWDKSFASFDEVKPFVAQFAEEKRERKDMVDWYLYEMTRWCERWALWARASMPNTPIYQSSGGWGFVESGTDFTDQTQSMTKIKGGIRSTNETDSYVQTFYATRMLSSAARFYGVPFGAEPAGFGSARGVMGRLFNILVNNGQHLFYYHGNLVGNDQAIDKWLKYAPLLDRRAEPLIEIAALYPDTMSKLDDAVFRNLYAFTFNSRMATLRPRFDFDFCSERMVNEGALPRYKALIIVWNFVVEADALNTIDNWVRDGGTVICSDWRGAPVSTVENDTTVWGRWSSGDTGKGKVIFVADDREPPERLARGITEVLRGMPNLDPRTQAMLNMNAPDEVYTSVLTNGSYAVLNFNDGPATVNIPGVDKALEMEPYSIAMTP